jgi:hypothetical protein
MGVRRSLTLVTNEIKKKKKKEAMVAHELTDFNIL